MILTIGVTLVVIYFLYVIFKPLNEDEGDDYNNIEIDIPYDENSKDVKIKNTKTESKKKGKPPLPTPPPPIKIWD
jgi:hypothetical protein